MKFFNLIKPSIDEFGLIAQLNGDGGDTFQREGMFMFGAWCLFELYQMDLEEYEFIKARYRYVCEQLMCNNSNYKRHVDQTKWYGHCDRMSRDQCVPNIISWGAIKSCSRLKRRLFDFFCGHLKRGLLFTTNTRKNGLLETKWKLPDITFIGFWAYYIRGFNLWFLYPLLCLFDLDLVINAIIKLYYGKDPNNTDDLNFIISLIYAQKRLPTFMSKLAKMIYKKRPLAKKHLDYNEDFGPQSALNAYFRGGGANEGPRLNEIYKPIVYHYLK